MEDNDFLPPRKKKKGFLLPSPAFNLVMRNIDVDNLFLFALTFALAVDCVALKGDSTLCLGNNFCKTNHV
jgi:hypothetical protein